MPWPARTASICADHAAALVAPVHQPPERCGIVERAAIGEVLDMGDEETAGEIALLLDGSGALADSAATA